MFYLFNCRSLTQSLLRIGVFSNAWAVVGSIGMLLLQLGFTYVPFMNALFHSAPMPPVSWLWVLLVGVAAFLMVGLEKWLRHRGDRGARGPATVAAGA